jgi:hypothetical protein
MMICSRPPDTAVTAGHLVLLFAAIDGSDTFPVGARLTAGGVM